MPTVIALKILPADATKASAFTQSLTGLTVTAFEVSFDHPGAEPVAGQEIGSASFVLGSGTRVLQHVDPNTGSIPQSVATAVIEVPGNLPVAPDVVLKIERAGNLVADPRVHYNVQTQTLSDLNTLTEYAALPPTIYVTLPPAGEELDPTVPYIQLPTDGTIPPFGELKAATVAVLVASQGGTIDEAFLSALTPAECRHLAAEIVNNQQLRPLPEPGATLEEMFTFVQVPPSGELTNDPIGAARGRFQGDLNSRHRSLEIEADRLGRNIYGMAAAISCELQSGSVDAAGLRVPARVASTDGKHANVILFNP